MFDFYAGLESFKNIASCVPIMRSQTCSGNPGRVEINARTTGVAVCGQNEFPAKIFEFPD